MPEFEFGTNCLNHKYDHVAHYQPFILVPILVPVPVVHVARTTTHASYYTLRYVHCLKADRQAANKTFFRNIDPVMHAEERDAGCLFLS